ncbi:MAG: hypothetical protein M3O35_00250 [Acidobacteriota bacterium]|nr:hypothetical protein [Acidobacteriota bacterium]
MNKFTRRELAAALSTSAVLLAQSPAQPQVSPPTPPLPADAAEELKASRDQLRANADELDKFALAMSAEPATIFKP